MDVYSVVFLFFAYSFLGWLGEVLYTAVVHRKYQDRGVLNGPLCILYGIGGLLVTFALHDLRGGWFFCLVFGAVYATVIEWIAGHILEYASKTRWWDYSDMPFNLDGYVCLGVSVFWGILSVITLKWGNPLLLRLFGLLPRGAAVVILWVLLDQTVVGRKFYALGGSREAARACGINLKKYVILAYALSGLFIGLAGVLYTSRANCGVATGAQGYEGQAISATVIGGIGFAGGTGSAWGAIVGAVVLGIISNILNLLGVDSYVQQIINGAIIVLAVGLDTFTRSLRVSQ